MALMISEVSMPINENAGPADLPALAEVSAPRSIGRGYRSYDRLRYRLCWDEWRPRAAGRRAHGIIGYHSDIPKRCHGARGRSSSADEHRNGQLGLVCNLVYFRRCDRSDRSSHGSGDIGSGAAVGDEQR